MRTSRDARIAGFSAFAVRKLMRYHSFGIGLLCLCLEVSERDATKAARRLLEEGLIEPDESLPACWKTTVKGNAFGMARANKPITRATADRLLSELLDRIQKVERNPYYLYRVTRLAAFGSYLRDDAERLGDIDLVIEYEPKEPDEERRLKLNRQRTSEAISHGRQFRNMIEELFWAEVEVRQFIGGRSKHLSFHMPDDEILKQVRVKELYPKRRRRRSSPRSSARGV